MKNIVAFAFVFLLCVFVNQAEAQTKPLKVFILVGQSNMQGHANVRTLPHLGMSSATKPLLGELVNEKGEPRIFDDIHISYLSSAGLKVGRMLTGFGADENRIGPELTFGVFMQKRLGEPILIIKAAWGGKSLHTDFRSPSAGPNELQPKYLEQLIQRKRDVEKIKSELATATGVYYRKTVEHVKSVLSDIKQVVPDYDDEQGYQLAGMVWFQGWNDMVDQSVYPDRNSAGGYERYSNGLRCLIRDFRKDLNAPELPFVIGVMGVGGPTSRYGPDQIRYQKIHQYFRDAMAAPANDPEFKGNVKAVLTEECWDLELDALVKRDLKVKQELRRLQREGKAEQEKLGTDLERLRKEEFSELELKTLETGVSNASYHYLGSGKIMALIGQKFAEAMPVPDE